MADQDLEWEEWDPKRISFVHHMIAGSCAGLAEHISIFPIDTLKTHIQCERCGAVSPMQTWDCATRIVGREGIFRLWRGVSAMFAGCIPAHAAYFSVFESTKILLGADKAGHHPLQAAGCGASAAFAHDLFMTPFDTVKQRMQLGYYKNIYHCLTTVAAKEGVRAFYLSLTTTLLMNIPYGSVMVAVNESARKVIGPNEEKVSVTTSMLSGSIAGAVAAATTTPFDVIKTRLQTQNLQPCPKVVVASSSSSSSSSSFTAVRSSISSSSNVLLSVGGASSANGSVPSLSLGHRGTLDVISQIFREDGLKGFARGMTPRVLVHAPAVAISWTAYETMKDLLRSLTTSSAR